MKKIKSLGLMIMLLSSLSYGCEIKWQNSLEAAKKSAAKSKKPIMVFASSTTCPYCPQMSETTFADNDVCELVNAKFVPLIAIAGGDEMPKNMSVRGVPAILLVNAAEKEVAAKISGLRSKSDFLSDLKQRNFQR